VNCNFVLDNLVAYIHGELDKKAVMQIHQHVGNCEACVQEEIELRRTSRMLDQVQFEALPDNFDRELQKKLAQIEKPLKPVKSDFRRIVYAIAATIIIMVGIQFFGSQILQSTRKPVHFKDFPTTQTVFKSEVTQSEVETSLRERFLQRYLQSRQHEKMKIKR
jgi:anti-sigma factor RsiW